MPVSERPNILFCLFDALSGVDSSLPEAESDLPTLARLRENSARFTHTYTPCPESSPARASLFTGLDPCAHGLWTNGVALPGNERTFPQRLAQAGYSNCLVGRRQLAGVSQWTSEHIPADEYAHTEWAHGPLHRSRQNAYLVWLQQTAPEHYFRIFPTQADPDATQATPQQHAAYEGLPHELSFNHWVGERIGAWITTHPVDQPFLAVAGFSVGSSLGAEPASDHDDEDLNKLALQQADAALGHILTQLAASKRTDDTVVIVAAGRGNRNPAEADNLAGVMSECCIRVPLFVQRPGQEPQTVDAPVSTLDIAPTVLELAGLVPGPRLQGRSLLGVLNGPEAPRGWAMSRLRRGAVSSPARNWQTALCTPTKKLIMLHGNTKDQTAASVKLFDLAHDPLEQQDLAGQKAQADELEAMIDLMLDARCALEDRTELRIASF